MTNRPCDSVTQWLGNQSFEHWSAAFSRTCNLEACVTYRTPETASLPLAIWKRALHKFRWRTPKFTIYNFLFYSFRKLFVNFFKYFNHVGPCFPTFFLSSQEICRMICGHYRNTFIVHPYSSLFCDFKV